MNLGQILHYGYEDGAGTRVEKEQSLALEVYSRHADVERARRISRGEDAGSPSTTSGREFEPCTEMLAELLKEME